jgi:hypothetical protein
MVELEFKYLHILLGCYEVILQFYWIIFELVNRLVFEFMEVMASFSFKQLQHFSIVKEAELIFIEYFFELYLLIRF